MWQSPRRLQISFTISYQRSRAASFVSLAAAESGPSSEPISFAFVNSSSLQKYAGRTAPRNGEVSSWVSTLDIKLTQEIPIWDRVKADLFVNLLNIGNMLNDSWGLTEEVPFSYKRAVAGASYNAAGNGGLGQWLYTFNSTTLDGAPIVANDFPVSRWQVQTGIRIRF